MRVGEGGLGYGNKRKPRQQRHNFRLHMHSSDTLKKKSCFSVQWFSADASIKFKESSTNSFPTCVPGSQMRSALHYLPLQMHDGSRGLKGPSLSQKLFRYYACTKELCLNLFSLLLALASSNYAENPEAITINVQGWVVLFGYFL